MTERVDVRLDSERREKLAEMSKRRRASTSAVLREAIDVLYESDLRNRRLEAAEAIGRMNIEALPEPEELSRQLDKTYDSPLP